MTEFPSPFPAAVSFGVHRRSIAGDDHFSAGVVFPDDEADPPADEFGEPSTEDDAGPVPRREGLPPSFSMRHEPHYVDALFEPRPAVRQAVSPAAAEPAWLAAAAGAIVESLGSMTRVLESVPRRGRSLHDRVALELLRAETARARCVADAVAVLYADLLPALDEVDLVATVASVLDGFAFEDRLSGLTPAARPEGACRVFGDPDLLRTAIAALVTAARTLAAGRGDAQRIGVSLGPAAEDGLRTIRIEQWAVRVPAASLARVFEPGWTGHPAGPTGGVLLAAARRIAVAQGGDVAAEGLDGGGSAFVLRLPPAG